MKPTLLTTASLLLLALVSSSPSSLAQSSHESGSQTNNKAARPLPPAPAGVVIKENVAYLAKDRQEKLDLYTPANRAKDVLSPAVVLIHGGGWTGGDKSSGREFIAGTTLAKADYVAVSINYLLGQAEAWPTDIQDCKNAVRWLRVNAERLQIDPNRIGVMGGSAGGHLALMVAYTPDLPALSPKQPYPNISDHVSACVDMYGISDLFTRQGSPGGVPDGKVRAHEAIMKDSAAKAPDAWKLASPVSHITKNTVPTLILHGDKDETVDQNQSKELAEKLTAAGVENRLMIVPGAKHSFGMDANTDVSTAIMSFFDSHLKTPALPAKN